MATRYEAKQHEPGRWFVREGKLPRFSRLMSESEAKIIEFALNAIANGERLSASHVEDVLIEGVVDDYVEPQRFWSHYDGPTEGVAP